MVMLLNKKLILNQNLKWNNGLIKYIKKQSSINKLKIEST